MCAYATKLTDPNKGSRGPTEVPVDKGARVRVLQRIELRKDAATFHFYTRGGGGGESGDQKPQGLLRGPQTTQIRSDHLHSELDNVFNRLGGVQLHSQVLQSILDELKEGNVRKVLPLIEFLVNRGAFEWLRENKLL